MKTLKLITLGLVFLFANTLKSQVSVNVNIGAPPLWGPVGYSDVRYYYLPDVESYYDVQASMFVFNEGGVWVHRGSLPGRYSGYDLYGGYKVVIPGYRGETPYTEFKEHQRKYGKGYHGGPQKTIGERPGKGNSGEKQSSKGRSNEGGNEGNHKSESHGHDSGESHNNAKSEKREQGHSEDHDKGHGGRKGKK